MKSMNIRIARELNKIAKELVAGENVANQEGKYKNFTGTIDWEGSKGKVKNATFELSSGIWWQNGTWEDGTWKWGVWFDGTWKKGVWKRGIWQGGTWENGTWKNGIWTEAQPSYHSIWLNGTWENGVWHWGTWKNGTWKDGIWKEGTWENGTWKDGIWKGGKDGYRKRHGKDDSPDKWEK